MSKLVNGLLEEYYGDTPAEARREAQTSLSSIPGLTTASKALVPRPPDPVTGYPCCTKAKPCKHWKWDELKSQYINELTGEVKEIV